MFFFFSVHPDSNHQRSDALYIDPRVGSDDVLPSSDERIVATAPTFQQGTVSGRCCSVAGGSVLMVSLPLFRVSTN